jgi:hypothetical protein
MVYYRIDFPKKSFEDRKTLHKYFEKTVSSYTGRAGKGFCFAFFNDHAKLLFIEELKNGVDSKSDSGYEFYKNYAVIR